MSTFLRKDARFRYQVRIDSKDISGVLGRP